MEAYKDQLQWPTKEVWQYFCSSNIFPQLIANSTFQSHLMVSTSLPEVSYLSASASLTAYMDTAVSLVPILLWRRLQK